MSSRNDARVPYPINGGQQVVSFSGISAATTNPVDAQTRRVVLYATEACHINFGATPVATTSDFYLPGGQSTFLAIRAGEKVAALQDTTAGVLHVSETTY